MRNERFSVRGHAEVEARVRKALAKKSNHTASNRELAKELEVDEKTIRLWKDRLGIPQLKPGTGEPPKAKKKPKQ